MKRLIWNRHVKLVLKHLFGWFCILAGLIMLITPGQGILTLLLGIFLLADHIPAFGRLRNWIVHRFPRTAAYVHQLGDRMCARMHRASKA